MNEQKCYRILIVDDEEVDIMAIERAMTCPECSFVSCQTGEEAISIFASEQFDCVIVDYNLPDIKGDELFDRIQSIRITPVVMITGQGSERLAVKLMKKGAANYLPKDNIEHLHDAVFQAVEAHDAFMKDIRRLQSKLDIASEAYR